MNDPFKENEETGNDPLHDAEYHRSASRTARFSAWISIAALCFTAIGITVGYKHWTRISDKAKRALSEISVIQQELESKAQASEMQRLYQSLEFSSDEQRQQLEVTLEELKVIEQKTRYAASTVAGQISELTRLQTLPDNRTSTSRKEVRLAEIRFMLEVARLRLQLDYDKAGALQLLKAADRMFIQIGDKNLLPIRDLLAEDIVRLQSYAVPDLPPLIARISRLEDEIKPLSVQQQENRSGDTITLFDTDAADDSRVTAKLKQYINSSITIRENPSTPRQNLSSSNKERIDQLMQLRLASLRMHVNKRQDQAYHHELNQIREMLQQFYLPENNQPWLQQLEVLDQITLNPKQPEIDSALNALLENDGENAS